MERFNFYKICLSGRIFDNWKSERKNPVLLKLVNFIIMLIVQAILTNFLYSKSQDVIIDSEECREPNAYRPQFLVARGIINHYRVPLQEWVSTVSSQERGRKSFF